MGYTNFGKIIRKEMIDHDENLLTIANLLNVTVAFVSAVLTGKKNIPDNWVEELSEHYEMNNELLCKLYDAYCEDKKNIKIVVENNTLAQKKLALQFQRKLKELNDDEIETINEILKEA